MCVPGDTDRIVKEAAIVLITVICVHVMVGHPKNKHLDHLSLQTEWGRWGVGVGGMGAVGLTLCRDHFVCAPSQWEMTLRCNVVSHWLGAHMKWFPVKVMHFCTSNLWHHCIVAIEGVWPWLPSLGLLSWYPIFESSHCNSFENRASMDETCWCHIFKWWLNSSPSGQNGRHCGRQHFQLNFFKKMIEFWFKFHWSLFPGVQLTIRQHWFR